jgi:hypothetical protein
VRDGEPPGPPGRYEVRNTTRLGFPVVEVRWVAPGEPPSLFFVIDASRVLLLAEALNRHLTDDSPTGELAPALR